MYSGGVARTYKVSAFVEAGSNNSTVLWVIDAHGESAVQNSPTIIEANGKSVILELRTTDKTLRTEALWIDDPQHDNLGCLGGGAVNRVLNAPDNTVVGVYTGSERVFRFTSPRNPTGLWVTTGIGPDQPVPTSPTAIEVGGVDINVVLRDTLNPKDDHKVCWLDVT